MTNQNITEVKEIQGLTEKENYVIGTHFVRYYGKTQCLLSVRLDDIDAKKFSLVTITASLILKIILSTT